MLDYQTVFVCFPMTDKHHHLWGPKKSERNKKSTWLFFLAGEVNEPILTLIFFILGLKSATNQGSVFQGSEYLEYPIIDSILTPMGRSLKRDRSWHSEKATVNVLFSEQLHFQQIGLTGKKTRHRRSVSKMVQYLKLMAYWMSREASHDIKIAFEHHYIIPKGAHTFERKNWIVSGRTYYYVIQIFVFHDEQCPSYLNMLSHWNS